ncbi:hypothetical protein M407DRAFT_18727 [Tulasnella calospora MUT 4182]|uniref:Protein kinase domain-containing protein n=1 Tax=Tulasnella calospora MUT 4182 TaxID=1051891 RepID=A0A0C3QV32_9AGAM|nr:hypothetical protein M407DRAFT_18727 [Tulasnella calospora MUT 4182]
MSDHVTIQEQGNQPAPEVDVVQTQSVKISPRNVLESLSTLRIEMTRIKPLETESWGRGGNADVIPAELLPADAPEHPSPVDTQHVAVKKMRLDDDTDDTRVLALLAHEVHLLNDLSHDNIIKVIGFVENTEDGIAWMVLPWEKNGNLREFIRSADWQFPERISLIYDVAKGIEYLHGKESPICHGDLKSLNILVNSKSEAVITDFGSARFVESAPADGAQSRTPRVEASLPSDGDSPRVELAASGETITLTCSGWTLRWAAPEVLDGNTPDLASDVMTGNFPFDGENDVSAAAQIVDGKLPTVHGDGRLDQVVAFANLMIDCWSSEPRKRLTAKSCERQIHWMERTTPCRRSESSEVLSARLLTSLAYMHIKSHRMGEAMDNLRDAMNISRSTNDHWAIANTMRVFGGAHRLQHEFSEAEESYSAACDIFTQINDQLGLANALNGLGEVHRLQKESSKAKNAYLRARDIYARIDNKNGLANSLWALGQVHQMRDESQAEESYVAARDIYAQIGNQSGYAYAAKALGDVYRFQKKYSDAEESYATARDLFNRIGDQVGLGNVNTGLGNISDDQGNHLKAEQSFQEAREIYAEIGDKYSLANTLWRLGWLHRSQQRYKEAEQLVSEASTIYRELGLENDVLDCDEFLDAVIKEALK